jgi:hypothetical protein
MTQQALSPFTVERTDRDLFLVLNGVRVARRGYPATSEAGTWVPLPDAEFVVEPRAPGALQ